MLSQGSEPIRAPASISMASNGLLGDENDLLSVNLFHLSGNKLDNELPGSSFHWGAFHFEIDGLSRRHCPRKFKGTQSARGATERTSAFYEEPGRHPGPVQLSGNPCAAEPVKQAATWSVATVSAVRQDSRLEWLLPAVPVTNPPESPQEQDS